MLEIGIGSGINLAFYAAATSLVGLDPSAKPRQRAGMRPSDLRSTLGKGDTPIYAGPAELQMKRVAGPRDNFSQPLPCVRVALQAAELLFARGS